MLEVGIKAPDFLLLDKDGNEVSLSGILKKHPVVVYTFIQRIQPLGVLNRLADLGIHIWNMKNLMYL